jgi:hypothetical protein
MIIRAHVALTEGKFFSEFVPVPKQLVETVASSQTDEELTKANIEKFGYASWYDFCELSGMSAEDVEQKIPEELDAEFGISDGMYQWEADNTEEE